MQPQSRAGAEKDAEKKAAISLRESRLVREPYFGEVHPASNRFIKLIASTGACPRASLSK